METKNEKTLRWWTPNYYMWKYISSPIFIFYIITNNMERWNIYQELFVLIILTLGMYYFWKVGNIFESREDSLN